MWLLELWDFPSSISVLTIDITFHKLIISHIQKTIGHTVDRGRIVENEQGLIVLFRNIRNNLR